MSKMRAKLKVMSVKSVKPWPGSTPSEELEFSAVSANHYPVDGADENNTYAKWTPSASLRMTVTNPDLFGQFTPGQEFHVDFTEAE